MFNLVMCYLQILQKTHTSLLLQVRLTTGQQSNSMYTTEHSALSVGNPISSYAVQVTFSDLIANFDLKGGRKKKKEKERLWQV